MTCSEAEEDDVVAALIEPQKQWHSTVGEHAAAGNKHARAGDDSEDAPGSLLPELNLLEDDAEDIPVTEADGYSSEAVSDAVTDFSEVTRITSDGECEDDEVRRTHKVIPSAY